MNVIEHGKPHSWLQWPVTLRGTDESGLHITAKYFGRAKINLIEARRKVRDFNILPPYLSCAEFEWSPQIYLPAFHVLELVSFPILLRQVHDRFDLIEDDFYPWRPHITVSREYWSFIRANSRTPKDETLQLGPLEYWKGKP